MPDEMTPKERYDEERRARERERTGTVRPQSGKRLGRFLFWSLIAILILGGIAYWLWGVIKKNSPVGEDLSQAVTIQAANHIPVDSAHEPYNSDPPTSGPHYDRPARIGFYEKSFSDERIIHNMEHGDVWISYRADVATTSREALRQFISSPKVIVTLRAENEWDIALAAWGRLDGFNIEGAEIGEAELQRIKDFVLRYQNKGPEKVINSAAHLES